MLLKKTTENNISDIIQSEDPASSEPVNMTVDELLHEFALENEDQLRQFANTINKGRRSSVQGISRMGIAQAIDKTFSKLERDRHLTKTQQYPHEISYLSMVQKLILLTQEAIKEELIEKPQIPHNTNPFIKKPTAPVVQGKVNQKVKQFIEQRHNESQIEFSHKLKQAVIDRMDHKEQFLQSYDINSMVGQIKETKIKIYESNILNRDTFGTELIRICAGKFEP